MAAAKCTAAGQASSSASRGETVSLAAAVERLNALSSAVSLEPQDYSWGQPSIVQQQALYSQFMQLCVMSSLIPQLSYASAMAMPTARPPMFPGFMAPFPGFAASPMVSPAPAPPSASAQPSQAPCAEQQTAKAAARPESKASKAGSPKKGSSKSKATKSSTVLASGAQQQAMAAIKAEDMDLDALLGVLGDDSFLEDLQGDVLSEGSNGSSSTMDGRLQKASSNGSFHNDFASAFDLDMDDLPAAAASPDGNNVAAAAAAAAATSAPLPAKSHSGDLNNLVSGSPTKSTRSSRREAAAAHRSAEATGNSSTGMLPSTGAAAASATAASSKISLKVKGGVSKTSAAGTAAGAKAAKAAAAVAHVAAGTTAAPSAAAPAAQQQQAVAGGEECPLSGAELSRLLGEDDNRIPDGWDLDLDFENPFSCSITAF